MPERELSGPYILQTASGETLLALKEVLVELSRGERTTNLGVCPKNHRRVLPGSGGPASVRRGGGFEAPCAKTGRRRSVIVAPGGSMWDSSDYAAEVPSGGGEQSGGTKFECYSQRRIVVDADADSASNRGTYQDS
jgi:hypothetical protein